MYTKAIELNNKAVEALQAGDVAKGFKILSRACCDIVQRRRQHPGQVVVSESSSSSSSSSGKDPLKYCFTDCTAVLSSYLRSSQANACSLSFLCLKFIRISNESDDKINKKRTSGVTWVLGYNLGILYALLGGYYRRGPPNARRNAEDFLKRSAELLGPIQRQVMRIRSDSTLWSTLRLLMLNNYSCVLRELSPSDQSAKFVVTTRLLIVKMKQLLSKVQRRLDPRDVKKFYLSLQALDQDQLAAAAA